MTRKEKITEILSPYMERERAECKADEILALPLDVPTEEEIKEYCNNHSPSAWVKWAIEEIKKRNTNN